MRYLAVKFPRTSLVGFVWVQAFAYSLMLHGAR